MREERPERELIEESPLESPLFAASEAAGIVAVVDTTASEHCSDRAIAKASEHCSDTGSESDCNTDS